MIYFFCGAHKNASHFQRYVVEEALKQRGLPYKVRGSEIFAGHDHVGAKALLSKLNAEPRETFICKGHWGSKGERDMLLSYPTLKVFLIWRHLLDVMISAYHFENNAFNAGYASFEEFYDRQGRTVFIQQLLYRRTWEPCVGLPNVHETHFEALKTNFAAEAGKMIAFAGIEGVSLPELEATLTIERLRETRNDAEGKFFRKGEPGEHKTFPFAPRILEDMERLKGMGSLRLAAMVQAGRVSYHAQRKVSQLAQLAKNLSLSAG